MHRPITFAAIAVFALAGCKKADDQPKTAAEVRAAVAQVAKPQPGKYRTTMTIAKIEFPGMPPQMADRMREMFAKTGQSHEFCLTKADADKGFEEFNKRTAQGACKYDRFSMAEGKFDAKMSCQTGKGMSATYEMSGEFSATGSHVMMKGDQTAPGMPGGGMHMEAEVASERIGDCG
jgi:hypothetical protein